MIRFIFPLMIACTLTACVKFGDKPPPSLLTLNPAQQVAPDASRVATPGNSLVILAPSTPQTIASDRLAVRTSDTSVAYLKDAVGTTNGQSAARCAFRVGSLHRN